VFIVSLWADANELRDWRIWADVAALLIRRARKVYREEDLGLDLTNTVNALDATTIDLCLSLFDWAPFRSTKAAVKMHALLDLRGASPAFIHLSDGKMLRDFPCIRPGTNILQRLGTGPERKENHMLTLNVNGRTRTVDVEPEMPLLWVLRDHLNLPGTKYGCGMALCGACTVHVDGEPVRSCTLPVATAAGKMIVTIEGLSKQGLHRIQEAWIENEVPQCGYCQAGMIMSAVALLAKKPRPTDADIDETMTNLCRCGTYARVKKAIHYAAGDRVTSAVADKA